MFHGPGPRGGHPGPPGPLGPPGTRTQVDQKDKVNIVNLDPGVQVHLALLLVSLGHLANLEP